MKSDTPTNESPAPSWSQNCVCCHGPLDGNHQCPICDTQPSTESPAPQAESQVDLLYRPKKHDDWGMIRTKDGELFAVVRRPIDNEEADRHRSAKTDPFEPLARRLMSTYAAPAPQPPVEGLREAALACADDLIAVCEAASRAAERTGNTFVLDRQRVAGFIQGRLAALASPSLTSGVKNDEPA